MDNYKVCLLLFLCFISGYQSDAQYSYLEICVFVEDIDINKALLDFSKCIKFPDLDLNQINRTVTAHCKYNFPITCYEEFQNNTEPCLDEIVTQQVQNFVSFYNTRNEEMCQDNGMKLKKLLQDGVQTSCIVDNFPSQLGCSYEEFRNATVDLLFMLDEQDNCKKAASMLHCAAEELRKQCDPHELIDFAENVLSVALKKSCNKQHVTKEHMATKMPIRSIRSILDTDLFTGILFNL